MQRTLDTGSNCQTRKCLHGRSRLHSELETEQELEIKFKQSIRYTCDIAPVLAQFLFIGEEGDTKPAVAMVALGQLFDGAGNLQTR